MNPLISIVIPYYDHSDYLRQAVESALAQTYGNVEVIVVDDDSSVADARELLSDLVTSSGGKLSVIRREANGGSAASKNTGVMRAQGEYILPLDSDDFLDAEYAEIALRTLTPSAEFSGVYTQTQVFGMQNFVHTAECTMLDIMSGKPAPTTFLYSRKMFDELGGYDTSIYHDDDEFWLRALSRDHKFVRVEKPLYHYRKHWRGKSDTNRSAALASFAKAHPDLYGKHLPDVLKTMEQKYFEIADEYQTLHNAFNELTAYHEDLEKRYAELASQNEQLSKRISMRVFEKSESFLDESCGSLMKVAFVTSYYAGAQLDAVTTSFFKHIVQELTDAGHETVVFALGDSDFDDNVRSEGSTGSNVSISCRKGDLSRYNNLHSLACAPVFSWVFTRAYETYRVHKENIQNFAPDVVLCVKALRWHVLAVF